MGGGTVLAGLSFYTAYVFFTLPNVDQIRGCLDTTMHEVRLCPGSAQYARLNEISNHVKNAVVISEDTAFYQHSGFDFEELKTSFSTNLQRGELARGGSTITQQLAKNVFLTGEKSVTRKVKEAILTVQIEDRLKKPEILERYLNVVEFGDGIYGIKKASQYYFSKTPANLNVLEAAFLAFLLPNPPKYAASFEKKKLTAFARKRLRQIVGRMQSYRRISSEEYQWAIENLNDFPWVGLGSGPESQSDDSPILELIQRRTEDDLRSEEGAEETSEEFKDPFNDESGATLDEQ